MDRAITWWKLSRSGRAMRLPAASANGIATPTMNMNAGWFKVPEDEAVPGHVIEPTRHTAPSGIFRSAEKPRPSDANMSMMKPR